MREQPNEGTARAEVRAGRKAQPGVSAAALLSSPEAATKPPGIAAGECFIRAPKVMEMVGLPESSLYELVQADEFPKPVRLSAKRSAWLLSEVQAWMRERIAERNGKAA